MKKRLVFGVVAVLSAGLGVAVIADSRSINFENGFVLGSPNGQQGWMSTGSAGVGCAVYDHEITYNTLGTAPTSFGQYSLRISSSTTSGCFGDQTFTPSLVNEAGETAASNGGLSGGTRQNHFEMRLDLASVTPNAIQPGLHLALSPDRGDGARMSYLRVEDNPAGIQVFFDDVQNPATCMPSSVGCADFVETLVATLDRTKPHTLGLNMDFVDGPNNDVVGVFIDNQLVHTGTSWEDYYAYDLESYDGSPSRTVDSVLFRTSGTATPATFKKGFLLDNISFASGPPLTKDSCKKNGWADMLNPSFRNQGQCVSYFEALSHHH